MKKEKRINFKKGFEILAKNKELWAGVTDKTKKEISKELNLIGIWV